MGPNFTIELYNKDKALLYQIKEFFGVGNINIRNSNNHVYYSVKSLKDISNVIIPHFDKYPLQTQKQADFELFKKAINLLNKKEHLTAEGLKKSLISDLRWTGD